MKLTSMNVLFLPRARILEPDLCHSLRQTSHRSDSLQILTIGITIYLKVCLQHLKLLLRERGPYSLCLIFMIAITLAAICSSTLENFIYISIAIKYVKFFININYRRSMSFHNQLHFPHSAICITLYHPATQIVHLLIIVGHIDRTQSKRDERLIRELAGPNRMLQYRDYTWSISHQSSWKEPI